MRFFKRTTLVILLAACSISMQPIASYSQEPQKHTVKPRAGYVPDADTAIKIAIAVWEPIYGKEKIEKEKPYRINLENGVWFVRGSLPKGKLKGSVVKGGVAEAEINKDDGCIIRISHGK